MVNLDIRDEIANSRVRMWEIARRMGITDSHLSRKFREELPDQQKSEIRRIIGEIKSGEPCAAERREAAYL